MRCKIGVSSIAPVDSRPQIQEKLDLSKQADWSIHAHHYVQATGFDVILSTLSGFSHWV
jgi:hypothetical protein